MIITERVFSYTIAFAAVLGAIAIGVSMLLPRPGVEVLATSPGIDLLPAAKAEDVIETFQLDNSGYIAIDPKIVAQLDRIEGMLCAIGVTRQTIEHEQILSDDFSMRTPVTMPLGELIPTAFKECPQ